MRPELPYYEALRHLCIVEQGLDSILEQVPGQPEKYVPQTQVSPTTRQTRLRRNTSSRP